MPKGLTIAIVFTAVLAAAGSVRAESNCWVPMTQWQPRSAVEKLAKARGWKMRRIRIDDGCYEMLGTDAQGRPVDVKLHPSTLEILEVNRPGDEDDAQQVSGTKN